MRDGLFVGVPILGPRFCPDVEIAAATVTGVTTVYTVPAQPAGINRLLYAGLLLRLEEALVGSGNIVVRVGTTSGGNELLLDTAAITSATAAGSLWGLPLAELGATLSNLNGYAAALPAGQAIFLRQTVTGTITGGKFKLYQFGTLLG